MLHEIIHKSKNIKQNKQTIMLRIYCCTDSFDIAFLPWGVLCVVHQYCHSRNILKHAFPFFLQQHNSNQIKAHPNTTLLVTIFARLQFAGCCVFTTFLTTRGSRYVLLFFFLLLHNKCKRGLSCVQITFFSDTRMLHLYDNYDTE